MLKSISEAISSSDGTQFDWQYSRDEVVEAVEKVFSAIKEREEGERELLKNVWEWIEKVAKLGGPVLEKSIKLGALAAFAPFAAIGAGYMAAANEIKRERATMGFVKGVVAGVMVESPENVRDYLWQEHPTANPTFEAGAKIAQYYHNGGLALGYGFGREVADKQLGVAFWTDVRQHLATTFGEPDDGWSRGDWIDFYTGTAAAFYRGHIQE